MGTWIHSIACFHHHVFVFWVSRVAQQESWLEQQVQEHTADPFWQVVGLLQAQLNGLYEGYAAAILAARAAGHEVELLSRDDVVFLNSNGEAVI